jgi:hypothetical protein
VHWTLPPDGRAYSRTRTPSSAARWRNTSLTTIRRFPSRARRRTPSASAITSRGAFSEASRAGEATRELPTTSRAGWLRPLSHSPPRCRPTRQRGSWKEGVMLRWHMGRGIAAFERQWNYDAGYVHEMIGASPRAAWMCDGWVGRRRERTASVDRHSRRSERPRVVPQGGAPPTCRLPDAHQRSAGGAHAQGRRVSSSRGSAGRDNTARSAVSVKGETIADSAYP